MTLAIITVRHYFMGVQNFTSIGVRYTPGSPVERQLREAGVRLFIVDVGLTSDSVGERLLSTAPDAAFAHFSRSVDSLLAAVPDAWIIIRFWMISVGKDFVEEYPQSLLAGPDGNTDWGGDPVPRPTEHTSRPNMLNEWRRYCGEHLYRFIHRLGASEYAPRVAGFYLAAMNSGEWWYYKGQGDPGWDYSETRKVAFETFVRQKYGDDPEAIAKAWGVEVSDDLLDLPTLEARSRFPIMPNSKVSDYLQVMNMPVSNAARYFARIIKSATHQHALAGMEIHMAGVTFPVNGTVFMNHLLDAPEIDFFGGPSQYFNRGLGSSPLYRVALQSLEAHHKLWLNEGDYRTPISYDTRSGYAGEPPPDVTGMKGILRREFARSTIFNYYTYLMDFGWRWFLYPTFMEHVGDITKADAVVRSIGLEREAEVAIVTDQESQLYGNYFSHPTRRMLEATMDRIGVGWDFYELRDFLEDENNDKYKLVIFLNICALGDLERDQLELLKRDGRHLLWMHNPGTVDLSSRGIHQTELISSLVGMNMRAMPVKGTVLLDETAFSETRNSEKMLGESGEIRTTKPGVDVSHSDGAVGLKIGNMPSQFFVSDSDAETLARDERGNAYFAQKEHKDWTSIYTAFCELPPFVIRALAKNAGCHIWVESEDVSFIGGNFVALHASESGEKQIRLPEDFSGIALDLFDGSILKPQNGYLAFPMKRGETRMLALGEESLHSQWQQTISRLDVERKAFVAAHPAPEMPAAYRNRYIPKPPSATDGLPLPRGVHTSFANVFLIAGPFPSDAASISLLDEKLADLRGPEEWVNHRVDSHMGTSSADFLRISRPLPVQDPAKGLGEWTAREAPTPWAGSDDMAIAKGQSFAGTVWLKSPDPIAAEVHFYVTGEARLWVKGQEVFRNAEGYFQAPLQLTPEPTQVVFRIRGAEHSTGFTMKLADAKRGREMMYVSRGMNLRKDDNATRPLPESVLQWIPQESR